MQSSPFGATFEIVNRSSHRSVGCNADVVLACERAFVSLLAQERGLQCAGLAWEGMRMSDRSSHRSVGCNKFDTQLMENAAIAPRTGAWVAIS